MQIKRAIILLLAVFLLLAGCSGNSEKKNEKKPGNNQSETGEMNSETEEVDSETGDVDSGTQVASDDVSSSEPETVSRPVSSTSSKKLSVGSVYSLEMESEKTVNPSVYVQGGNKLSTLDTDWEGTFKMSGKSDAVAAEYRTRILNSKNTAQLYKISGKTYYVSPDGNDENDGLSPKTAFKTVEAPIFKMDMLKPGDAVLFERGGIWRLMHSVSTDEGVIYGAYGKGEKPTFYGSAYNYADSKYWTPSTKKNVWKATVSDFDIGLLVFDHGKLVSVKKTSGLTGLGKNGDFYYNRKDDTVYLYYDSGNPGTKFKDIEICLRHSAFTVNFDSVVIDNLKIKYFGSFGISLGGCNHTMITNCELGFIGGALQNETTRYGNAIQQWNGGVGHLVENCWVYQIYDTGLTWQGQCRELYNPGYKVVEDYTDFIYRNNLIEYCSMSVEFWHDTSPTGTVSQSVVKGFIIENNVSRFAGYGWGSQRPDPVGSHIRVGSRSFPNAVGNKITGNIFDMSLRYMVEWRYNKSDYNGEWAISGNTYYQTKNLRNEAIWYEGYSLSATNKTELNSAVSVFDSAPSKVNWIG